MKLGFTVGAECYYDPDVLNGHCYKHEGGSIWLKALDCFEVYLLNGGLIELTATKTLSPMGIYLVLYDESALGQHVHNSHYYITKPLKVLCKVFSFSNIL